MMLEERSIGTWKQEMELTSELREPLLGGIFLHSDHELASRGASDKGSRI